MQPVHAKDMPEAQVEAVRLMKQSFDEGSYSNFNLAANRLPENHILAAYRDIWRFRFFLKGQERANPDEEVVWATQDVLDLSQKHPSTWPTELLLRDWLQQLARTGKWDLYKIHRPSLRYRPDTGTECADLLWQTEQGNLANNSLWSLIGSDERLPRTCRVAIRQWVNRGHLTPQDLDRHVLQLTTGKSSRVAFDFIREWNDTAWGKSIDLKALAEALDKPSKWLDAYVPRGDQRDIVLAVALARLANSDPIAAARRVDSEYKQHLSPNTAQWLWGHIAHRAALLWLPEANAYFARSKITTLGSKAMEWRVRSSLLARDWPLVINNIQELPPTLRDQAVWQYWRGRALLATDRIQEARQEFIKASGFFSFYGKLASEELGPALSSPKRAQNLSRDELLWAKRHPGLQRALALYQAGLRTEGFWEFNLQVAQMNDRELLATARWAQDENLLDRAIAAADRTREEHDIALRYPTPFRNEVLEKSEEANIDAAWVYGLIRQESRFVTVARSNVGASGLMQLMPATAQYMASKLGMKRYKPADIQNIDTNLTLGTHYLKGVYEGQGQSMVLASAAYNAGPSRPTAWRKRLKAGQKLDAAIFTELIPFDETRDYVKHVLSNSIGYSTVLNNNTPSLKQRLGMIEGLD